MVSPSGMAFDYFSGLPDHFRQPGPGVPGKICTDIKRPSRQSNAHPFGRVAVKLGPPPTIE